MGDGLDVVDERDGDKDGSQVSALCEVVASCAHHRAKQPCKRMRREEKKIRILVLDMKNLRCL